MRSTRAATSSAAYEVSGRSRQKQRTKAALIVAARELVARGATLTIDDAAAAAGVSRATAYRYFPSQDLLLAEAHPETTRSSLLPAHSPEDPVRRLKIVMREYTRIVLETEPQQRAMLRLSLDGGRQLPLRQGRAIGWIEDALAPLRSRLGAAALHRLALQIRSATGIESLVWLVDIGGMTRKQAVKLMCESADALLERALERIADTN